jgi:uncharacterized protein
MNQEEIKALMDGMKGKTDLIETHISFVILTRDLVYKIKKPMRYSFLDFSTLERRKFFCARELELNRRLAPEMYLAVVPIHKTEAGFAIGVDLEGAVEYALQMKRMDGRLEMDRMLERGEIDADYLRLLARKVAAFHAGATVVDAPSQCNSLSYQADFNDILTQADVFGEHLGHGAIERLHAVVAESDYYLQTHAALISKRLKDGFIRDVHGDLHTRNIFAYPEPVIFDCIEFNDHFRQIDVLNEVAFFCMDLEAGGRFKMAEVFLEGYEGEGLGARGKGEELLFVWFKCYRANVRAKVNALWVAQGEGQGERGKGQALALQEMERYLGLMEGYAGYLRGHRGE